MNTKELLIDLIENKGVSARFIAKSINIPDSYITAFKKGDRNWGKKTNKKFLDFYNATYK